MNKTSADERIYSTLIRVPLSHGLLSECIAYRNVKVLVSDKFEIEPEISRTQNIELANENCTTEKVACKTGVAIKRPLTRCIDRRDLCNHIVDCEDKSDETSCNDISNARDNAFFQCATDYSLSSARDEPTVQQTQHDNNKPINEDNAAPHANQKLKPKNSICRKVGFLSFISISDINVLSGSNIVCFCHNHIYINVINDVKIVNHAKNIHKP